MDLQQIALVVADIGFPAIFCLLLWRYIERHGDQELAVLNKMCIKLDRIDRKLSRLGKR